jgi:hypothetical protein
VNAFLYAGDYALAGRWFERAARVPGAPLHVREAVMALYVKGGQAEIAIRFLTHMLQESEDPESRQALEAQLKQAYLERSALLVDEAVERFIERTQRRPNTVQELVTAGLLGEIPPDPYGGSWVIDQEGRVHSSVHDRRVMRPESASQREKLMQDLRSHLKGMQSR